MANSEDKPAARVRRTCIERWSSGWCRKRVKRSSTTSLEPGCPSVQNHVTLLLWRHPVLRTRLLPNSGNSAASVTTSRTEGTGGQTGKGADHGRGGHGAQRHLGPAGRPADG